MFQEITVITKSYAEVILQEQNVDQDILNFHVVFEDEEKKILGEIDEIIENKVRINFLGEFVQNKFVSGIIRKPNLNAKIRIIKEEELSLLIGSNDKNSILIGSSPLYNQAKVYVNINDFLSNHNAIFGNTGSGKTWGVARIIQNLFTNQQLLPYRALFCIFNTYSEYHNAFNDISKINPQFHYKKYTTNTNAQNELVIKLPLWLLDIDDYANLLDVTEYSQISIIEKALNLVSVFARNDADSYRYKNHLIAKAIMAILFSNQTAFKVRDQVFSILNTCNTKELNLNVEVPGVGYTRSLNKCFDIDSKGDFVERILLTSYIEQFVDNDTQWKEQYIPTYFTLRDLENAFNFAFISEGLLLNEKTSSEAIALKVKLHSIESGPYGKFFEVAQYITLEQYLQQLISNERNERVQIINFTLEDIDDRFAKTITKIYARLFFRFTKSLADRASFPIHMMLEEAHRYVQKDSDGFILGYNIFERIAKEGRKYGLILDLITQRPTELNDTTISQCTNFLIFKINHPYDLEYIEKMVPNISKDIVEKQKTLQSGTCVAFGRMMKIPMIVRMDAPNPKPYSDNCDVCGKWMTANQTDTNIEEIKTDHLSNIQEEII